MLTLKLINEETERVIRGLEKKHFPNAKEAIDNVLAVDKKRREAQQELDKSLNEQKQLSGQIGRLMKEGKKDEAEQVKAQVAALKEKSKQMDEAMANAQEEMTTLLCQIPNIPYDEVPEGKAAEDNHVVKSNLRECKEGDTVGVYIGKGAQLQRALINFFLAEANKAGYTEIMPPTVVNAASGYGTGQLPDKEGQMYHCEVDDF